MNQRARQRLGSGYVSYIRLKLQGIANDVADIVARAYAYPADSGQASFVRTVMLATIADRFPAGRAEATEALIGFLRTFDLAFTDRRLRFVIQGVNDAYRQDNPRLGPLDPDAPATLDMVKAELYARIEELWAVVSPASVQAGVGQEPFGLFDEEQLAEPVRREVSPQQFAHDHGAQLDALLDRLGAHLDGALKPFPGRLWELFVAVTSGWPELQQLLLVRFLGFPVWDTLILPIVELSEIRQLRPIDIVRISPRDGQPGRLPPKELKGAAVHHFGAFFDRTAREHDFLWGRLDGAEQLLNLVASDLDERWYHRAFQAVLEEEGPQLPAIQPVIQEIRAKLSGPGAATLQFLSRHAHKTRSCCQPLTSCRASPGPSAHAGIGLRLRKRRTLSGMATWPATAARAHPAAASPWGDDPGTLAASDDRVADRRLLRLLRTRPRGRCRR